MITLLVIFDVDLSGRFCNFWSNFLCFKHNILGWSM